jgi:hypothetical protein
VSNKFATASAGHTLSLLFFDAVYDCCDDEFDDSLRTDCVVTVAVVPLPGYIIAFVDVLASAFSESCDVPLDIS